MPNDLTFKTCHTKEALSVAVPILDPAIRTVVISLANGLEVSKRNLSYQDCRESESFMLMGISITFCIFMMCVVVIPGL